MALVALVGYLGPVASARAQAVDAEARFLQRIDEERAQRGLSPLAMDVDLQRVARAHAARMAEHGEPYHNPSLGEEVEGWEMLGENVGMGWEADGLHRSFMESPTHRDIILAQHFTEVGFGVLRQSDGRLWVVQVFRRPSQPATTASAEPVPAPPAPEPPPPAPAPPPPAPSQPEPVPPAPAVVAPSASSSTSTVAGPAIGTDRASSFAEPALRPALVVSAIRATAIPAGELDDLAREIPAAAWLATLLLAAVVGGQGLALRRLGLA